MSSRSTKTRYTKSAFHKFEYAIRNELTRESYHAKFKIFLQYLDIHSDILEEGVNILYDEITTKEGGGGLAWFSDSLMDYIMHLKHRVESKEITAGTLRNYYKPIKLFCDMNDILLNWKLIGRGIPTSRQAAHDRAPTIEEIHKLLEFGYDERVKPVVLLMVSSGIRLGAWDYLKWKHVTPIYNDTTIIVAKLVVYAGEPEQYFTFMTPEAYFALKDWMAFRESFGEKITGESWVMRDKWQTTHKSHKVRIGMAAAPRKLSNHAIRRMIHHIYFKQNIRPILPKGEKRHEFKTIHGFRKYFKTVCESGGMKPANVELLIGHDLGLSQSYYKPTENQLLEDYLKVVNALTIDKAFKLQKQLLETKKENELYRQDLKDMHSRVADIERLLKSKPLN